MKTPTLPGHLVPSVILGTAVTILVFDYLTGPDIRFTILYVIPVAHAAWSWSLSRALMLALTMPLFRLGFAYAWIGIPAAFTAVVNTAIQWLTLIGISLLISRIGALQRRVRVLEGILPICSFCKKIRTPEQNWETIEEYITQKSEAKFSHGVCPTCARQNYPEYYKPAEPTHGEHTA